MDAVHTEANITVNKNLTIQGLGAATLPWTGAAQTVQLQSEPSFTLGAGTGGINPVTQPVTLQIGPYSVTIPAGSFRRQKKGAYVLEGVINGVSLQLRINPAGGNNYALQAEGSGANLSGIVNPVTVTLTIGGDAGSTSISPKINRE